MNSASSARFIQHFAIPFFLFALILVGSAQAAPPLQLRKGDHIAYIGNATADRMQHSAWLETYIHGMFPEYDLTVRNLGYPGDELKIRNREDNFGSPDEWLTKVKASVVFCFFGHNEALKGPGALEGFKKDLAETIDSMLAQKYDGQTQPRLVFFSPIAHENLNDPNLPDGQANNANFAIYTRAMKEVCESKNVLFVDIFAPSKELYAKAPKPLTMNGIHLADEGDQAVSQVIAKTLFPNEKLRLDPEGLGKLRAAVLDKNDYWFNRYRVVDGYNVFGGRSKLAWFGQSNADVMMREMEIFDVKTANRDGRVWAVAKGSDLEVKDDNLPEVLTVKTNIPGVLPDGKHKYLGGQEAISKMKLAKGMQINLFASEEMFPELINPVQMAVDPDGRLFASVWPSYPHWNPTQPRRDKIICLPDDNGDGVADRCVTFADELNSVTGFEFWNGGMLVAALPEIWFLKDTDGDEKADLKIRMLQGVCSADSHHSANAMLLGPDGWLYWSRGIFNIAAMETPTKTVRSGESGVHRFNPRTFEMEFHFPIGPNPHGDVFDQWGYQFANDGTSGTGSYVNIGKGIGNKQWFKMRVRPVAATGILSSSLFPEENQGNFLICNCIGFLGVLQHKVKYNGADITCEEVEPIVVSSDPNFRPSDVEVGGDGALYVADWQNAIIGHMQHNMRDPNRDDQHGRIYRVTAEGKDALAPAKLRGKPIPEVLAAFTSKENGTRYRARIELSGRKADEVVASLNAWSKTLDPANAMHAQALLEGLWVLEEHRRPDLAWIAKTFLANEPRVRAAAIRTLGHWSGRVDDWGALLLAAAKDESPLVRAEAVKAAVEFDGYDAIEAIFEASVRPTDPELDTVIRYAKQRAKIDQGLQDAIASKKQLSEAAMEYALKNASPESLLKLPQSEKVFLAILDRSNASTGALRQALQGLSQMRKESSVPVVLKLVNDRDQAGQTEALKGLRELLLEQPLSEIRKYRGALQNLATKAKQSDTRQLGFAAWATAEGNGDAPFATASASKQGLGDLLKAIPEIADQEVKKNLFQSARALMFELPGSLGAEPSSYGILQPGIQVDYFYPAPDNVAAETLAAMKPNDGGVVPQIVMNVPQRKQADDFALRFTGNVIIPQSGKYTFFVASDDGSRIYIDEKLLVNNDRLQGMTERSGTVELSAGPHKLMVTYFDNGGGDGLSVAWSGPGIQKQPIPTDRLTVGGTGQTLHDLAIRAVISIPGNEKEKFADLTKLVKSDRQRTTAVQALRTLPDSSWDPKELPSLVDNLVGYLSSIPAKLRTSGPATETVELVKSLSSRLPADLAKAVSDRLGNLDVRTIAIGTVVERMIYDKERIVLEAGKPVEFRFANTDNMPHNFVIVQPGSLEEVGLSSDAGAQEPDARERNFVPKSDKILLASKLIGPGESQAISFDVPTEPGMYPYVCTYPGHWRRMFGVLVVVSSIEQYNNDPEAYLASNPLEIRDELLKSIGRNTEWKMEDLTRELAGLKQGRSYEVGKSLFAAASCVGCHKLGGEGKEFGPDLSKLDDKKMTADSILKSLLMPSADIEDKYRARIFQMDSDAIITGMVVEETDQEIKVMVDPLAKGDPTVLDKEEIVGQKVSSVSTMPQGLLNKLTKEEILDLMAYVLARGDKKHPAFHGHEHGDHNHGDH
jgi:putative heme-binding domain-containing protein